MVEKTMGAKCLERCLNLKLSFERSSGKGRLFDKFSVRNTRSLA